MLEITTGSLGNGNYSANIINSAQFSVVTPTPQTLSGIISGPGVLSVSGDVALNKNNTYTGQTIVISGGKLNISQLTFADLTTSAIVNAGILTFSGSISMPLIIAPFSENNSARRLPIKPPIPVIHIFFLSIHLLPINNISSD